MNWLQKIAIEGSQLPAQRWYHGTDSLTAYSFIHEMILKPRKETGEASYIGSLSSIPTNIYLTNTVGKAAKHAVERSEQIQGSQPVILVINPESLGFVQVDEDFIHMMLNGNTYFDSEWYPSPKLEHEIWKAAFEYFQLDGYDDNRSEKTLVLEYIQERKEGWAPEYIEDEYLEEEGIISDKSGHYEYDETMHAAKNIATELNEKHQQEAINNFGSLAHEGQVKASEIYLIPEKIERQYDDRTIIFDYPTNMRSYEELKQFGTRLDPNQLLMPFMTKKDIRE